MLSKYNIKASSGKSPSHSPKSPVSNGNDNVKDACGYSILVKNLKSIGKGIAKLDVILDSSFKKLEKEKNLNLVLNSQNTELENRSKETAIELDMLERMQVVWKENTERHAHELEKLQQDNANLKKTCDTLQEKARTLEESSQKASRDHSTAMKETEQRAAETNQLWQEIKRLEKQLAGAEKQHAIFKKEIQMKS